MGKKAGKGSRKSQGKLNTPFKNLKLAAPAQETAPKAPASPAPPTTTAWGAENVGNVDDATLFSAAMGGVTRHENGGDRVDPQKTESSTAVDDDTLALAELESFVSGDGQFALEDSGDFQCGRAPGVNKDLLRRLKLGEYAFRRHLDLHGMVRQDAHTALGRFVAKARRDGERCVLIITGRGKGSPGGIAVIRDATPRWLGRAPIRAHVLAFCTAKPIDGGPGALYVLLRRSGVKPFGAEEEQPR